MPQKKIKVMSRLAEPRFAALCEIAPMKRERERERGTFVPKSSLALAEAHPHGPYLGPGGGVVLTLMEVRQGAGGGDVTG